MSASTACDGLPHLIPLLAWAAGAAAGHEGCEAGVAPAEMRSPPWSASWEFGYGLALCRKRRLLKWSSFGMLLVAQRVNRKRNRCFQEEMLTKLARREKTTNIKPDHDIDVYMKILDLEVCADTLVGKEMMRGISGGQRKHVTIGKS
uniref:Uncharacterized protein n=1 Tax=Zea mays TaxID=4577 RepID=A0A804QPY4_MAIZE